MRQIDIFLKLNGGKKMGRGGWSWKRATGITGVKRKISRATGIPLTRSGRQRKVGKILTGGGCLLPIVSTFLAIVFLIFLIF
jgi:hypothetical protein